MNNTPIQFIPIEPKRLDDEISVQLSMRLLCVLAIMSGMIGLCASAWLDHHYKTRDLIEQEQILSARLERSHGLTPVAAE